jgi:hypothetical protein
MVARSPLLRSAMAAAALFLAAALAPTARAVDGVIEINQTRAAAGGVTPSDAPGWPVTIDSPGSYRLTGNLTLPDGSTTAIEVTAGSVSIDLNEFEIACSGSCGGPGAGIEASSRFGSITVANGRIIDMGTTGIDLPGDGNQIIRIRVVGFSTFAGVSLGSNCRITDSDLGNGLRGGTIGDRCLVRGTTGGPTDGTGLKGGGHVTVVDSTFNDNDGNGLDLGADASVVNVTAIGNDFRGIMVGARSTVEGSRANSNGLVGIQVGTDGTVLSNAASSNGAQGLSAGSGSGYGSNVFNLNNGGNASPQVSGGIEIGTNVCGGDTICP